MGNLLRWASVTMLGLFVAFAGIGWVENPDNNLLAGVVVLYSGIFIFAVGAIQVMRRGQW
tara:strand:+ start:1051 stop:1230 length:180 start_codon:yes stop_codon:yes gene_type:complete